MDACVKSVLHDEIVCCTHRPLQRAKRHGNASDFKQQQRHTDCASDRDISLPCNSMRYRSCLLLGRHSASTSPRVTRTCPRRLSIGDWQRSCQKPLVQYHQCHRPSSNQSCTLTKTLQSVFYILACIRLHCNTCACMQAMRACSAAMPSALYLCDAPRPGASCSDDCIATAV